MNNIDVNCLKVSIDKLKQPRNKMKKIDVTAEYGHFELSFSGLHTVEF